MKWLTNNWPWIVLALLGAVVFLFWEWQCNAPMIPPAKMPIEDTARVNTLARANDSLRRSVNRMADQSDSLRSIKAKIIYVQAKPKIDTIELLNSCDSLNLLVTEYIAQAERQDSTMRDAAKDQAAIIINQDSIIAAKDRFAAELRTAFLSAETNSQKITIANDRRIKWFKVKEKTLVIAVLMTGGKILFDALKK